MTEKVKAVRIETRAAELHTRACEIYFVEA